jgi:DNA-damage-inducible protein D
MASELANTPAYRHTMTRLEHVKRVNSQGDDYWVARQIYPLLGYAEWDSFLPVIERAEAAIRGGGGDPSHHIRHTTKMVEVGSGAKRRVVEVFLSRGACYLIAMNGDPRKPEVAGAQQYFAVQARNAELAQQEPADRKRLEIRDKVSAAHKRVSTVAQDAGVERFGIFHNARYEGLYGASKREVDRLKGLKAGEQLFDRAGSLELSAHEFQMQLAATKIVNEGLSGERPCVDANLAVAREVRETIRKQSGVRLEEVPLEAEPIKQVRKRLAPSSKPLPRPR